MKTLLLATLIACWLVTLQGNDLAPLLYRAMAPIAPLRSRFQGFTKTITQSLQTMRSQWMPPKPNHLVVQSAMNLKPFGTIQGSIAHSNRWKTWFENLFQKRQKRQKVLILMSDTGGGHRASAQAIDQALQVQFPHAIDVEIMDIWTTHAHWPFNRFVPTYRFLAKHPLLWRGFYAYGSFSLTRKFTEVWSWKQCFDSFEQAIRRADPDFIVSVHPLCQLIPLSITSKLNAERLAASKPRIPFITIVTDLGSAHPTWFDNRCDALYVPSDAVRLMAIKNGIQPSKIILKGLPIRPAFWKESGSKQEMRKALSLSDDKTVLLMGGGDGVGGITKITSAVIDKLLEAKFNSQLIVICGHNQKLVDKLKVKLKLPYLERTPPHAAAQVNVHIKGFVENIDEYMTASDCLITKAGPGTIVEAMIRGLPVILSSYLPGQVSDYHYCIDAMCVFVIARWRGWHMTHV